LQPHLFDYFYSGPSPNSHLVITATLFWHEQIFSQSFSYQNTAIVTPLTGPEFCGPLLTVLTTSVAKSVGGSLALINSFINNSLMSAPERRVFFFPFFVLLLYGFLSYFECNNFVQHKKRIQCLREKLNNVFVKFS